MPSVTPIKDRASITDHVADYMHANSPSLSIDVLLCRPTDAMKMALAVAESAGRMSSSMARKVRKAIEELERKEPSAIETIDEVCRTALSSRKRGELKRDKH